MFSRLWRKKDESPIQASPNQSANSTGYNQASPTNSDANYNDFFHGNRFKSNNVSAPVLHAASYYMPSFSNDPRPSERDHPIPPVRQIQKKKSNNVLTVDTNGLNATKGSTSHGYWDDATLPNSAISTFSTTTVTSGHSSSSTLKTPRGGQTQRSVPYLPNPSPPTKLSKIVEQKKAVKKKSSRWLLGFGVSKKSDSTGISSGASAKVRDRRGRSGAMDEDDDGSGFVVKSFRTVSRVYEDPVQFEDPYSRTTSSTMQNGNPRQSSATLLDALPTTTVPDYRRSRSPTISVEAFRQRTKSISSSSICTAPSSPELHYQAVSNNSSERGQTNRYSTASEYLMANSASEDSIYNLPAPKPRYPTSSSLDPLKRVSTTSPKPASSPDSFMTAAGYSSGEDKRQARMSKGTSELSEALRVIGLYEASLGSSPPKSSATIPPASATTSPATSTSTKRSTDTARPELPRRISEASRRLAAISTPSTTPLRVARKTSTPSLAIVPPSPAPSLPRLDTAINLHSRSRGDGLLSPASMTTPTSSTTNRQQPIIDWNDPGDDMESSSDEEDDIPLATLPQAKSKSTSDLSLYSTTARNTLSNGRSTSSDSTITRKSNPTRMASRRESDVEILADFGSPTSDHSAMVARYSRAMSTSESPPTASLLTATTRPVSTAKPSPAVGVSTRRPLERRAVSTLSFSQHSSTTTAAPSSPTSQVPSPSSGSRSYSNPSTPRPLATSIATDLPSRPPQLVESRASRLVQQQRSSTTSSSSGSGSGSGSSQPRTPLDGSPATSTLGVKGSEKNVQFNGLDILSANGINAIRRIGSQGILMANQRPQSIQPNSISLAPASSQSGQQQRNPQRQSYLPPPRPASTVGFNTGSSNIDPRLRTSSYGNLSATSSNNSRSYATSTTASAFNNPRRGSTVPAPASISVSRSTPALSNSSAAKETTGGEVYNRMKARHRVESMQAISLGRDLNGDGLIKGHSARPGDDADSDDDDDHVPLAAHAARSRAGSQAGSVYGSPAASPQYYGSPSSSQFFQQQQTPPPPSVMGGYSTHLSQAPPGVDPQLYASLPPDQKLSLHHQAEQMLRMMQVNAMRYKAESEAGGSHSGGSQNGSPNGSIKAGYRSSSLGGKFSQFFGCRYRSDN